MKRIGAYEKIASFMQKEKQPYEFKRKYAQIRAEEFKSECDRRGLNCHVSVGGLDSIVLFLFLREVCQIDVPGVSASTLEDKSIQKVHKAIGIINVPPLKRDDGKLWTKARVIQEFGFPVISKEIAGKIELLQNPTEKNKTVRHAIITGETGEYGGWQKNSKMQLKQKWLELFGGYENENEGCDFRKPDFLVSSKCCYYLKEKNCDNWGKEHNSVPYLGLMASEGGRRAKKTMDRIARGLKKFVLDNPEPFIIQCNHGGERRANDIREPMPTITGKHGYGIVEPYMVQIGQTGFTKDRSKDVREPLTTIVSKNEHCLISPTLIQYHSETSKDGVRGQTIEDPIMTVDSSNRYGLVTSFLHKYYDGGYKGAGESVENPLPTVTAWDHNSVVTANLIQMNNHCDGKDIRLPLPTITAGDGHFGEVRAFLIKYYGQGTGQDIEKPLDTVTAQDRFGLVTINGTDYQIVDIGLRMLEPRELYGCQGFPDDYIIDHDYTGKTYPRSEQVRRCGNAVCPPIPAALVKANLPELCVAERTPNMQIKTEQTGQLRFA